MRVLVTGWPSFLHGEATAGDVRSMCAVADRLSCDGIAHDVVWSPRFAPDGLRLEDAEPAAYTHVVFACGPLSGWQIEQLHGRYPRSRRIAVGVTVIDASDPAAAGFDLILPRDGAGTTASPDLATRAAVAATTPVVGVVLAPGQPEYGERRRHQFVHNALEDWLLGLDCARLPLDSRLDTTDWRLCATADQFAALVARTDLVVTTRLHGLVFALCAGIPALAVDPVAGGGKVSAQAGVWEWPAVIGADRLGAGRPREELDRWWTWCRSAAAKERAEQCRAAADAGSPLLQLLSRHLQDGDVAGKPRAERAMPSARRPVNPGRPRS
ncbi:polysaccharide pyruvyl transferase family protein [Saccharopolyspora sp. 5N102]|uniref:polysaccharide pyruvyl transferase family protein n=1 Tax=Saccharopolyspora sp. 5N102 TaxID=3375155 RepID=UPI00379C524B